MQKPRNAEAYLFTPLARGAGRLQELPAVVVSGRRRARADHRRLALSTVSSAFCLLTRALFVTGNRQDSISLRYPLPIAHGWNTLHWY